jgi:hypothetical protein
LIPVLAKRFSIQTISHGAAAFLDKRLASHQAAGMIHLGGHGHPDRVDDGVTGTQAGKLKLAPCVVFNGACYTGVTSRWFDPFTQKSVVENTAKAADSFCLNMLDNQALGYLAALHVDHGMPVYQEMEFLAYQGASLGDAIKFIHDGVILGSGGKLLKLEPFVAGKPPPNWTASEVMLKGTASRVLFGDPALILIAAFTEPPLGFGQGRKDSADYGYPQQSPPQEHLHRHLPFGPGQGQESIQRPRLFHRQAAGRLEIDPQGRCP